MSEEGRESVKTPGAQADVEAHISRWSDEELKQAITKLEDALAALQAIRTPSKA